MKQKFLDVLSPFFESTDNDNAAQKDDNDINDILSALAPLIKKSQEEEEEEEEREEKKDEKDSEEKEEPDLAIEGKIIRYDCSFYCCTCFNTFQYLL